MSDTSPDRTSRRTVLQHGLFGAAALSLGPTVLQASRMLSPAVRVDGIGLLGSPDALGIRLPKGFQSRLVATSGREVDLASGGLSDYVWHDYPDGGATFAAPGGGWVYVSNSETLSFLGRGGGVGALRFDTGGRVVAAYGILSGTDLNCAGGPTPWGSWLSCEEIFRGRVFECDPQGVAPARALPALGLFRHEAAAVDPRTGHVFMTEDEFDGRLYRFVPKDAPPGRRPHLEQGSLQVAVWLRTEAAFGHVKWLPVPNPQPDLFGTPTRFQVPASTAFNGGEGMWYHDGRVYFATKGDNRVWCLDLDSDLLSIRYDVRTAPNPILTGVDNVTVERVSGQVIVAEDGGDMQLVVVDAVGRAAPLLQVTGQLGSEITGPAFSPDGTRLYFSSQRGNGLGLTYEIRGPFSTALGC